MKIKIKVLTPLKEYVGGWSEDVTKEEIKTFKEYMSNISNLDHLQITNETETYFFPREILQKSVVTIKEID